jgi:hypothetical protein
MMLASFLASGLSITATTSTAAPRPATAVASPTTAPLVSAIFELDSNAVQDGANVGLPNDWAKLYSGGGSAETFTGILCDRSGQGCLPEVADTIFDGGKKDIQDISRWSWKQASGLPDKDDITNAYAAAFVDPVTGRLIIYFGADRYSNVGDAFIGYWLLKGRIVPRDGQFVVPNGDGTFSAAHHQVGDILVLVNFPQASGAVPEFAVLEWNPAFPDAAENLHFLGGGPGQSILCNGTDVPPSSVCATTNSAQTIPPAGATSSPWPYVPKSGTAGVFPYESFFEGGIDLAQFGVFDTCFSTFICETRSSKQFTATLKDFTLGSFETCRVECGSTSCSIVAHNADYTDLTVQYTACVENDGNGTFPAGSTLTVNLVGRDGDAVYADAAHTLPVSVTTTLAVPLVAGGSVCLTGTNQFHTLNNPVRYSMDATIEAAGGVSASTVPGTSCDGECLLIIPDMSVSKSCEAVELVPIGGNLVVKVSFSGTVTNLGNQALTVTLSDEPASTITPSSFALAVGASVDFTGYYYPSAADGGETDPCEANFTDTITAVGDCAAASCPITRMASATCHCPNPQ